MESPKTNILTLEEIKFLISDKRDVYNVKQPAAKANFAEFKPDSRKNLVFKSLNSLAKHLNGDRQVIREYLTEKKTGYYRGVLKFTYQK